MEKDKSLLSERHKIPLYTFKVEDRTYRVLRKKWDTVELDKDYAYTLSDLNPYVYPYRGFIDKYEYAYTIGLYSIKSNGKVIHFAVHPKTELDKKLYHRSRMVELRPDIIFTRLKDDISERPEIVVTDGDIFAPPIRESDDIALIAMKHAISAKKIDYNAYGHRFPNTGTKNNNKRILTNGNTLKMETAGSFASIFDLNIGMIVWDKDGAPNPMNKDGVKRVYAIFDGDELDFTDADLVFEVIGRK